MNVNTKRYTLRSVLDSSGFLVHDEFKCDDLEHPDAQSFIDKNSENYLVVVYDRGDAPNDYNTKWKGVRKDCITKIPKDRWIYQALVFGQSLEKIDPSLTIELTYEQAQGANNLGGYYSRPGYYKDIAGKELTDRYKMWHVFCERPKWEAGKVEKTNYNYISSPPKDIAYYKSLFKDSDDIDSTWRNEIAMQNGMAFGVDGYNDVIGS